MKPSTKLMVVLGGLVFAAATVAVVSTSVVSEKSRAPASANAEFIVAAKPALSAGEIEKRIGMPSKRSRAVVINTDQLFRERGQELKLRIELFPGVAPLFTLKVLSGFNVNEGMHSGFAEDDPNSRLNFTTTNGMLSGFIEYRGRKYRIVADPAGGVHYVIEEK